MIPIFKNAILPERWEAIRSVEIYAMCYRKEDIHEIIEARSQLQLRAWSSSCSVLRSLPHLRHLRVFLANPLYLDRSYLTGRRVTLYEAVLAFLRGLKGLELACEIYTPVKRVGEDREQCLWNLLELNEGDAERLELELKNEGWHCNAYVGDVWSTEEEIEQKMKTPRWEHFVGSTRATLGHW